MQTVVFALLWKTTKEEEGMPAVGVGWWFAVSVQGVREKVVSQDAAGVEARGT